MTGSILAWVAAITTVALLAVWKGMIQRVEMSELRWIPNSMAVVGNRCRA